MVENQVGEDYLDAKAVQAGENLDQFLNANANDKQLIALRAENDELKRQSHLTIQDLNQARSVIQTLQSERDDFRKKLEANLTSAHAAQHTPHSGQSARPLPLTPSFNSPVHRVASPVIVEEGPICKVAERVRIKRLDGRDKLLTGSQIASFGV